MTVADESEDHSHHLPAVEDWPRGFGEASWWPFVTALGGAGFYVAAALFVLGQGESSPIGPMVGPAAFALSTLVFLGGIYGWLYHGFVVGFWNRARDEQSEWKLRWGMYAFLGSELATFSAGFIYYFFIRVGAWEASELPPILSSLIPGVPWYLGSLVVINTIILVISSFTLHYSHKALLRGDRQRFIRLLSLTLLLGVIFIAGQAFEYYEFIVHEGFIVGSGEGLEGVFSSAFYGLTGLHGLHVSLGAVMLGIVLVRALRGQYSADRHVSVSTASMYWHFVDAVWIFLVVVLYIGAVQI